MSVLEKVRRWVDGDSSELVLEQAARDAQIKPRSKAEEFMVTIAREVESVMQRELVPLPQGTTIIPTEYIVFLSTDDDKEWQGVKRRGLEQGLYHILGERAKEIAGKKRLETKSFTIELRIDGTLEKGVVRVEHSWEESSSNKTGVLARPKGMTELEAAAAKKTEPDLGVTTMPASAMPRPATPQPSAPVIRQAVPIAPPPLPPENEEMTHVASRARELYRLEIWRGGVRQNVIPVYQSEIVIGRGSKSKPVDIPLSGDVEVSRRHLVIGASQNGTFWVMNEGRNPAAIGTYELPLGQRVQLEAGAAVTICSYLLRIQQPVREAGSPQ